ncbi:SGNH/GDSL hydrolase family protein [Candidatus Enterococcus ferrettii]|uniref:SGNH hydrolase-type esterase domain-containing protein n=1 Tax=Candidatus Enterococcus ferrettii TaxID=2815324 RepID=A0ABV0EMU3_9ENTE|nr:GDSL-type esterase/lipase family protein [Enterococcus sp. 665A]MBO1338393.1 SGNH/GDSL hydrolase family protein [Enterococcus sp. 665A]
MKTIALYGDSLMTGLMNGETSDILNQYVVNELADMGFPGYEILEFGKRGEGSAEGLERLDEVVAANADFVVICFGTNDSVKHKDPIDVYGDNLRKLVGAFSTENVIVLTPGYVNTEIRTEASNDRQQEYAEMAKQVAKDMGVNVIDLYHHMTIYPAPKEFLQDDGLHPSDEGYHFLGALIARDIKNKLLTM